MKIQNDLFNAVEEYLETKNLTRSQFAEQLGVSKGYVTQIMNGEFDHRISKLVEIILAIDKIPDFKLSEVLPTNHAVDEVKKKNATLHCSYKQDYYQEHVIGKGQTAIVIPFKRVSLETRISCSSDTHSSDFSKAI